MDRAKVSVCLIVRDDASSGLLDDCFNSIRPFVEEIVVVDTGSTDNTPEVCQKYADIFEVFTACNDPESGAIADFAMARNRAFDLATQRWVMWLDSDDVLAGGEHLKRLIDFADSQRGDREWCYLFPYEYVYSADGKCTCLHYRERLVSNRAAMRWVNPVHEVMLPQEGHTISIVPIEDVIVKHQRQRSKKVQEGGRNLRILQKFVEVDGSEDPRQFYYLGLEYANAQQIDKAIEWLSRYVSVSGWKDEKTMAFLKLAELSYAANRAREGLVWAHRAMDESQDWGEGYFAVARGHYALAIDSRSSPTPEDAHKHWEKCAHWARVGLSLPPTRTMLFVNPLERSLEIHVYLTMAYSQLGRAKDALRHADEAFKVTPEDPNLVYNRRIFQRVVAQEEARLALNRLVEAEGITPEARDSIVQAMKDGSGAADGWPRFERPAEYPKGVKAEHFPIARITPHARAFGLPSASDIDDLPVRMTDEQVEAATILLWKEYMLHDEVLAAAALLANAPYRARHSPIIEKALTRTRRMMEWMDDAKTEQEVNTPADPTIENGVALPYPLHGAVAERSNLVTPTLEKCDRILDLGCFDGGIVNRWGLAGLDVTGVDLCKGSIALAERKAEEFGTGAKFICSKFSELRPELPYDVVTCCDTYEHVRDHVKDLIAPARRALNPMHGRMLMCTPHGAWMRGYFIDWAHPWRWAEEENRVWNTDLPHAHLIAPTPWSVAGHFREDGWWVKDSYVVESKHDIRDVYGQGNVYCEARLNAPALSSGEGVPDEGQGPLDIVFACGDAWENWNPLVHRTQGIGGSETMVVEMAKRLSLMGHRVRVFTSTGKYGEGIFDGVEYRQTAHLENVTSCDVIVAWRNAALTTYSPKAKLRLLWVHDIFAGNATHRHLLHADRILALSEWHKQYLIEYHKIAPEHVLVTRNGIDLQRFAKPTIRNPHKMVYSSSPDRGLPVLLHVWPKIRERVPDAELHIFYGFENWEKVARIQPNAEEHLKAIEKLKARMGELASQGVVYRGKVDQRKLAEEYLSAGVWGYPTWFSETSCLGAMEAQAAGLRIVTSSIAALNETVGEAYGTLIDGDWLTPEYQSEFIDQVERAMTATDAEYLPTRYSVTKRAENSFGLDSLADDWVRMMHDEIARLQTSPLTPYRQRFDFVREEVAA